MTDPIKEAVHEVWVRRIVVIEEECCIAVRIREDEGVASGTLPLLQEIARGKLVRDRALKRAAELIADGTWTNLNLNRTVVAEGAPLVGHVSGDVIRDDLSE